MLANIKEDINSNQMIIEVFNSYVRPYQPGSSQQRNNSLHEELEEM